MGCKINGNMAVADRSLRKFADGSGRRMKVDQKEYGKWGKGNKETAAAQNQMKSSLENVSN